ncbi:winged helix-turn-helix transcriptional regulator [Hyunsoonleella sp. SJ7]|uniref:Winged helix-turn-helix transcriptional regulator n=1 Tax=Hyunsoonleella aquatilis TaxID=2762758 RepID=A0A923H8H8_9FLAO|nr:MarR family winged helix-turn-helix transcriptional regulator [Hyunsoonleella aquatilis]MBC3758178.1 winged helix-turn-helix transcriptional regulator [Hyunsoonleella aquatilis]
MSDSIFNPNHQENDIQSKIVAGLERISEAFKVLLWEKAKLLGLSPIQIQILIFINYHKLEFCNVSHLAKEFNVTKPTISDAVRVLLKKELIEKVFSSSDSRSYAIQLSGSGKDIVAQTENFAQPLKIQLDGLGDKDLEQTFKTLSQLIFKLNKIGVLTVQRTCYACKFYQKNGQHHYCNLLEKELQHSEIRVDCPEFEISN